MQFSQAVKEAYATAASEKATYPRLAQLLTRAGVRHYVVDVQTGTTTYYGTASDTHGGDARRAIAASFSQEELISALRETQAGKMTYPQFLDAIAAAGVQTYLADLAHMRVIYMGHGQAYEESIPQP